MAKVIRTVGVVEQDETRVRHIHTKITGWIEDLHVDFTGKEVRRGAPLLSIYSPELVSTQEEYLLALRARERVSGSPFPEVAGSGESLLRSTRRRLELWDITEAEIRRLEETGEPKKDLTLYSPISGFVLHKTALEGMYVQPGTELFTIADLSEVWVHADVYEYELPLVAVGQEATLTLSYSPGELFHGRVDYVYPTLDAATRTAKVRFRFPNAGLDLKPQMYANVEIRVDLGERLAVPEEAILDTGRRQVAFIAEGDGWFAPREVKTGQKAEGLVEVLEGLAEGERVVTSGNFMIDSESRLEASITAAAGDDGGDGRRTRDQTGHAGH
jgi:Cu(I)/Ag(I) efflux system membrane fusion protein